MKLSTVHSGLFKLDGGAMFGVVPKQMWKKINPPDENNMCTWAMKCLLLEDGPRKILFDTGMGQKQGDKFRSHFEPHGPYDLIDSLKEKEVRPEDITDVFITHLHFDHVGGAISRGDDERLVPTFPNAKYWSNQAHWEWAKEPNPRERASFLKENFMPLEEEGLINFIDSGKEKTTWIDNIDVLMVDGHTEKMMIPHIQINGRTVVFCADLLASSGHLGLPYVMAYDIRPLSTMKEKKTFLDLAIENNYLLYLEHDPVIECIEIGFNDRGRYVVTKSGSLDEML